METERKERRGEEGGREGERERKDKREGRAREDRETHLRSLPIQVVKHISVLCLVLFSLPPTKQLRLTPFQTDRA